MNVTFNRVKVGDLQPSQLFYAYGIGAVVDLPSMSVMVLGLDDWELSQAIPISEDRLLAAVKKQPRCAEVGRLHKPPIPPIGDGPFQNPFDATAKVGVPVVPFPSWVICPKCRLLAPLQPGVFTLKTDPFRPDKNRFVHSLCNATKPPTVIPTRFLVACDRGHLDDFPWLYFVHQGNNDCPGQLKLIEYGVSGAAADIEVRCERCNAKRRMSDAYGDTGRKVMPRCRGRHPHLRSFSEDDCTEQMESILLGASNSWFPIRLSALSLPSNSDRLGELVEKNWPALEGASTIDALTAILQTLRALGQMPELLKHPPADIWERIRNKREGVEENSEAAEDLKGPEWRVFSQPSSVEGDDNLRLTEVAPPEKYRQLFERVVRVEKLREVGALVGFTRIESPFDFDESMAGTEERTAPLSRKLPKWVPASENKGEGIFIQFNEDVLNSWLNSNAAFNAYEARTLEAHKRWRQARQLTPSEAGFPGVRYLLLHSFSHALMRQLSINCGYSASSLRERIYSKSREEDGGPMAGVLLYTAAADSEGTLGGLVSLGDPENLGYLIQETLDEAELCASDPLCAEHDPIGAIPSIHWASCHACLFAPETSCERGNKYLDRALLTQTVKVSDRAFFES
jgi:Domain of unknown function (DUF1998)